ncbi:MAG: 4Fe-4S binding protein [Gammaproteobacteria bacterium]|nr:4Fe-4S binding protein [Gammaproteobacteria bacterium]MCP5135362.1 4Fe-4S binding protein [Gammaproteobacteria bacterium]
MNATQRPFRLRRHLNKLRWVSLSLVFAMLVLLPMIAVYQNYVAAHAYDLLSADEQRFYDLMERLTSPFAADPAEDLDAIKGTTWAGRFFGFKIGDPLSALGQVAASGTLYWPLLLSVLIPAVASLFLGRFFCGWICPASFLYELNTGLGVLLDRIGLRPGRRHLDRRLKYLVLAVGLGLSAATGTVLFAAIYPPAVVGRELYYAIALNGFGTGAVFFVATLLFDLLVARRGFCRYLCAGGALYSLLGRYRLLRIQRIPPACNDCTKCNVACEFGLDPMRDGFGQECNNCTACIAACPTDALEFKVAWRDQDYQGPGHLGRRYRHEHGVAEGEPTNDRENA